ncbi:hypothetical protein PsorP6_015153 [Peronosclerospora sorghi]|uniref:Uncharacterized protein n=1 Tax=Peronosclerospora sorghi TaxID=230839 RepID=A0ACC0VRQ7_9STRA|nr:hypothetical protein PsorP6_015153 [Peronosclerospora sorghi]
MGELKKNMLKYDTFMDQLNGVLMALSNQTTIMFGVGCRAIFETCTSHALSSGDITSSLTSVEEVNTVAQPPMKTDEFISVHLFQLLVTCELLRMMCDPQDITGEMGYYYLTTFEMALDLLIKRDDPHQPLLSS